MDRLCACARESQGIVSCDDLRGCGSNVLSALPIKCMGEKNALLLSNGYPGFSAAKDAFGAKPLFSRTTTLWETRAGLSDCVFSKSMGFTAVFQNGPGPLCP